MKGGLRGRRRGGWAPAPVKEPVFVHEGEALEDLVHDGAHGGLGQRARQRGRAQGRRGLERGLLEDVGDAVAVPGLERGPFELCLFCVVLCRVAGVV